jgi:hypothetical protein
MKVLKYTAFIFAALVTGLVLIGHARYFAGETGPDSIACSYSRIGYAATGMFTGGLTDEQIADHTATSPACRR